MTNYHRTYAVSALTTAAFLFTSSAIANPTFFEPNFTPSTSQSKTNHDTVERLRQSGRWMVDSTGRVVIPTGINLVNKERPWHPAAWGFGEDDAAYLASLGITSVRLGIAWEAVEPQPGHYNNSYLAELASTVNLLHAHGIRSLLDMHQDMYAQRFQGNGAPEWAVNAGGIPAWPQFGFPTNYFVQVAVQTAYDNLYDNTAAPDGVGLADHYAAMWQHVATYFKDSPGVMGYDLYNEPFPGKWWIGCVMPWGCPIQDRRLAALQQKTINKIRAVDQQTIIFYEPQQFFNIGIPTHVRVSGTNLGLSFHDYCTGQALTRTYFGCNAPDNAVFANVQRHMTATGHTSLLTEFGAMINPDVLNPQIDKAMANSVGWQFWHYNGNDPTTSGPGNQQALVYDLNKTPTGDNVDHTKETVLAIPHAEATAGIPVSAKLDRRRKVYTYTYSTGTPADVDRVADARTEIVVPQRFAPNGFTVNVAGGNYQREHDRLFIAAAPANNRTVTVTITAY